MRIVIDLQGAQNLSRVQSAGHYSLSLALAMARNAKGHQIWLALNGAFPESILNIRHAFDGLIPHERIRIFEVPISVSEFERTNAWRIRAAEKIREHFLERLKPDVVHVSSFFGGFADDAVTSIGAFTSGLCTAVTLYDLIPPLSQQECLTNDIQRGYCLRKVESLKKADLLLTFSEAMRSEAIEILQLPKSQVVNVSTSADGDGLPDVIFEAEALQDVDETMAQALSDLTLRNKWSAHGLNQESFSKWDECAKRVIVALEILGQSRKSALTPVEQLKDIPELLRSIAEINDAGNPADADLVRVAECIAFNSGHSAPKQLLLDISELVQRDAKSGIQRVVRSLLHDFIVNPPLDTEVRPIFFDGTRYKYADAFTKAITGQPFQDVTDEVVDFCQDDIYLALDLNLGWAAARHDLNMRLQCRGIKLYFIVYDILLMRHPEWWLEGTSAAFEAWLNSISEVATGLICISEAVAEEVRAWLKQNPPQRLSGPMVSSFHLGADVENSLPSKGIPDDAPTIMASRNAAPSFLIVGTLEPRKGHAQTIAAFELLWERDMDVNLVIVGKQGWLVDHLVDKLRMHSELNKHLFWLEAISDEYLAKIYAASTCLIAASEGEGFGLPLIEAAQHKKPIIARDIPVFREVASGHAFYFDGLAPENLADAITTWLSLKQKCKHPKSEGMHYLTWQECAQQLKRRIGLEVTHS